MARGCRGLCDEPPRSPVNRRLVVPGAEVLLSAMQEPPLLRSCTLLGRPMSSGSLTWCLSVIKTWASQPNSGSSRVLRGASRTVGRLHSSSASPSVHPVSFPPFPWADPRHSLKNTLYAQLHLRVCFVGTNLQLRHLKY